MTGEPRSTPEPAGEDAPRGSASEAEPASGESPAGPSSIDRGARPEAPGTSDAESSGGESERPSYRSAAWVGLVTLLSRLTGLLRETTRAHFLGTGLAADAFQVAFMLPNVLRRLVGEGAISSALVPIFSEYAKRKSPREQKVFAETFLTLWTLLVLAATLAGVLLGGWFVTVAFQWGSFAEASKTRLTAQLTSILFWYLLFVGLAAALQGLLNARKYFAVPSAAPLLLNLSFVICGWGLAPLVAPEERVFVLAGSVLLGGVLQLVLVLPLSWRIGIRLRPRWHFGDEGIRRVMRLFGPAIFGAGIYQINVLLSTLIAGRLEGGSVSALSFSARLMEVVLGVFVFALSTVSLTSLSRQAADDDLDGFRATFLEVHRWVVFITVPSSVGLYLLREPVISLLLQSGEFSRRSLDLTAFAFQCHVPGLCFVGISRVLVNAFYAIKDVKTPVRVAGWSLLVNLSLAWILSEGPLAHAGIALASSISVLVQAALLARAFRGRVGDGLGWRAVLRPLVESLLPSAIMGAAVASAAALWLDLAEGKLALAVKLALVIPAGAAIFFAAAWAMGVPEARAMLARWKRR
ncbi:MAG: murein biosynthesis integral membrane protein MurJ [Planctomycetes bacterium]|nr:murein biosynthesis integral membrane protein MurJ [Planctomycetota bacterium]